MNSSTIHETGCEGEAQHLPAVVVVKRPGCSQPCSTRLWPANSNVKRQTALSLAACNANGCIAVEPATAVTRGLPCLSQQARQGAHHATLNTSKLPTEDACPEQQHCTDGKIHTHHLVRMHTGSHMIPPQQLISCTSKALPRTAQGSVLSTKLPLPAVGALLLLPLPQAAPQHHPW
jgi:hypothetical protein